MAYVNGKWLKYDERAVYLAELREEKRLLSELLNSGGALESDLTRLEHVLDEIDKVGRVHRGEKDVLYFGPTYFSEDGNADNPDNLIPEGINYDNSADFHKMLCGMFDDI